MATQLKRWTLEEVHSLPDDGNKYELVRGELFVTPAPTRSHEYILGVLTNVLVPYVIANNVGMVYRPRAVMRFDGSEVEPDLMVRAVNRSPIKDWDNEPTPMLVVEVLSDSTRRRDQNQKRQLYLDAGVAEYWMVDPERREIRVVRPGVADAVTRDELAWLPNEATTPLVFRVAKLFDE